MAEVVTIPVWLFTIMCTACLTLFGYCASEIKKSIDGLSDRVSHIEGSLGIGDGK